MHRPYYVGLPLLAAYFRHTATNRESLDQHCQDVTLPDTRSLRAVVEAFCAQKHHGGVSCTARAGPSIYEEGKVIPMPLTPPRA